MKTRKYVYALSLLFLTLSGFGQMPIFKRYYVADIPGLGWLAQFYVTHHMHYISAMVLLALVFYILVDYALLSSTRFILTRSGAVKAILVFVLVLSGVLMVIKNLEGVFFPHNMIISLDLVHLGSGMGLLAASLYTLVKRKAWVVLKNR